MNYYRRYSGDYLRDTSRLSMVEHGAYNLLLDYYYSEGKPLPPDLDEIYTMVRAMKPAERAAVDKVLSRYFVKHDDGYHNGRADEELALAAPLIEAARVNGKKGGRPKNPPGNPSGSDDNNPPGNPTGNKDREPSGVPSGQHPPSSILQPPLTNLQPPTTNRQEKAEARATRLPNDWALPEAWGNWAVQDRGWSGAHTLHVAACFRDHWVAKAGKDGRKLDWEATWRNWCRNQRVNGAAGKASVADRNAQAAQEWLNSVGEKVIGRDV